MLMELRTNWKVLLTFLAVVSFLVAGMVAAWPSMGTAFQADALEGEENVSVELEDLGDTVKVHLQWSPVEGADNYTLLAYPQPQMLVPERAEGIDTESAEHLLEKDEGGTPQMYFAVVALVDGERQLVGMASSLERTSVYEETFGVDMSRVEGMASFMWDLFWGLLMMLFLGYVAASTVSRDFEERKMDIILSKPVSRRRYLLEKFAFLTAYTALMLLVAGLVLVGSMAAIGELSEGMVAPLLMSSLLAFPVVLLIMAVGTLAAVYVQDGRTAVGLVFLFVLLQVGINLVASMAEGLEHLSSYTAMGYWDLDAILFDNVYSVGDFVLIAAAALAVLAVAVLVFERRDMAG